MQASGNLHVLFQAPGRLISTDSVTLHDTFPGGLAFRSPTIFCVGHHLCLSDGIEAMEVTIQYRREDGGGFVYVVSLGELEPLPAHWRPQLSVLTNRLEEIVARCEVHEEKASA